MGEISPRAKRHSDYVQVVPLVTEGAVHGAPSLRTFVAEELRANLDPEPDGYARITKEQANEILAAMDGYAARWGPLVGPDEALATELRQVLADWDA